MCYQNEVEYCLFQGVSEKESELKIKKLEDLLQVTQFSLTEHIIRCQQLQAKLDLVDFSTFISCKILKI